MVSFTKRHLPRGTKALSRLSFRVNDDQTLHPTQRRLPAGEQGESRQPIPHSHASALGEHPDGITTGRISHAQIHSSTCTDMTHYVAGWRVDDAHCKRGCNPQSVHDVHMEYFSVGRATDPRTHCFLNSVFVDIGDHGSCHREGFNGLNQSKPSLKVHCGSERKRTVLDSYRKPWIRALAHAVAVPRDEDTIIGASLMKSCWKPWIEQFRLGVCWAQVGLIQLALVLCFMFHEYFDLSLAVSDSFGKHRP